VTSRGHYIGGEWIEGTGTPFSRENPSTGEIGWQGRAAVAKEIDAAAAAARSVLPSWADASQTRRSEVVTAIAEGYKHRKADLVEAICRQTGKPRWEAALEVDAMIAKAAISIAAQNQRRSPAAGIRYRPIGVLAVIGPFNMPGHLPNGHLMPAVLAGNPVIFKPSELTPRVGELLAEIWAEAGIPPGVFNMVQGGAQTGSLLTAHPSLDGVLFTGSVAAGSAIHRGLAGHPEKLLALEMGGNNPLIAWDCADLDAAAYCIVQSAFITSGQRCTCARRLIVRQGSPLIERLVKTMSRIRAGIYTDQPEPFMGTVISAAAAQKLVKAHADLKGRMIVEMRLDPRCPALLHPGLIDMTGAQAQDTELFGPLLQLIFVGDFDAAIAEANRTRFGLAAGLLSDDPKLYESFARRIRAGVLAFNRPTTGARSDLPFGGIGVSGNHRPSALFAADYCCDPIASAESPRVTLPEKLPPGLELA